MISSARVRPAVPRAGLSHGKGRGDVGRPHSHTLSHAHGAVNAKIADDARTARETSAARWVARAPRATQRLSIRARPAPGSPSRQGKARRVSVPAAHAAGVSEARWLGGTTALPSGAKPEVTAGAGDRRRYTQRLKTHAKRAPDAGPRRRIQPPYCSHSGASRVFCKGFTWRGLRKTSPVVNNLSTTGPGGGKSPSLKRLRESHKPSNPTSRSRRYVGQDSSNSACVPTASMRPASITTMRSAMVSVERRWAMRNVVRPWTTVRSVS